MDFELYTEQQLADKLHSHVNSVKRWSLKLRGFPKVIIIGRKRLYDACETQEFLEKMQRASETHQPSI